MRTRYQRRDCRYRPQMRSGAARRPERARSPLAGHTRRAICPPPAGGLRRVAAAVTLTTLCAALCVCSAAVGAAPGVVGAWGGNDEAQLGDGISGGPEQCIADSGALPCSTAPLLVGGLGEVVAIASSADHSLALLASGTVMAWGGNRFGQLGDGQDTGSTPCRGDKGSEFHCQGIPVQVSGLHGVVAIAAGRDFSLALLSNGTVMAWGSNADAELGDGTSSGPETCAAASPCATTPAPVAGLAGVVALAAGTEHSLALLSDGSVMAWGYNGSGRIGDGTDTGATPCKAEKGPEFHCQGFAVPVSGLSGVLAVSAAEGSLAALTNGRVRAWGPNGEGQLGDGTSSGPQSCGEAGSETPCSTTPAPLSGVSDATAIAAGEIHGLALRSDGSVVAWGSNREGQLGTGTNTGPTPCAGDEGPVFHCQATPAPVSGLSGAVAIAASWPSLALRADGTVVGWGVNRQGELADGSNTGPTQCAGESGPPFHCQGTPATVGGMGAATAIALGGHHGLVLQGALLRVSPSSISFGARRIGTATVPQVVTVSNAGPASLAISGETLSGSAAFVRTNDTCAGLMLAAGASCQIALTFAPASTGVHEGTLALQSSAVGSPARVALAASGLPPRPLITGTHESRRVWRVGSRLAHITSARSRAGRRTRRRTSRRSPVGTTFSFRLNETAAVRFAFTQRLAGQLTGGRCLAPTPGVLGGARCTRTVTVAAVGFGGHAGLNRVRFQGRVPPHRRLRPGHYRLVISASNTSGRSNAVPLSFTITRR
jgi:alpha-tubulin suppressor-like RCC1 family protein